MSVFSIATFVSIALAAASAVSAASIPEHHRVHRDGFHMTTSSSVPTPSIAPIALIPPPHPRSPSSDTWDITGGFATFFYQKGNPGACGTVHSDYDLICAIDQDRYGNSGVTSGLCGQQVQITNNANGNTVVVTIADDCPTCNNGNSIDLSLGAFEKLADPSVGQLDITWGFIN